jgi:hypothetical protein
LEEVKQNFLLLPSYPKRHLLAQRRKHFDLLYISVRQEPDH